MDSEWNSPDQHTGKVTAPKVTLAGSVEATCSGQLTVVDFLGDRILLSFGSYRAAANLRRQRLPNLAILERALSFNDQKLIARVGTRAEFELFPNPSWWVRFISPQVRQLNSRHG